ncbi:hypothetical protein QJS10_CPA06g00066 [Acorus calamus]|uniref:Thiaminase-2/PQQC domain-containing protein n=1 Tax=Acorus calamus TaxID=4465 RepID=A0AAV9EKF6_ACOCL|nr:hypothetical protein QJS10_CPA06g00066 [Acorus calamus]
MRFLSLLRNPNPNISSIPFKSLLRSSAAGVRTHRRWFPTPSPPSSAQVRRIFASFSSCPPPRTEMAVVATEEEGAARRLWIRSRKEATFAAYTPFVVCLASGVLELDVFRHYVAQDVHFLRAFAQAYEMAGDCADDDDDKAALSMLRKAILDELKMHDSVVDVSSCGFIDFLLGILYWRICFCVCCSFITFFSRRIYDIGWLTKIFCCYVFF